MKKINCKLIVSDFDGTLLITKYTISQTVKDAINEYVASGGIFAVCTGRMLKSILPRVRELGLKGFVAALQGTVIADIETGEIIKCGGFKNEEAKEICDEFLLNGYNVNAYCGNTLYTTIPQDDKMIKLYLDITKVEAEYITDSPMGEYLTKNNIFCQKVGCLVEPKKMLSLYETIKQKLGDKYDVNYSAVVLIEVSPKGDDKGEVLRFLSKKYGVPMEKCVAVGDSLNDLSMIKQAGIGVAVANAAQPLKDEADYITVSNDEDAIAKVIQKFGFIDEN